MPDPDLPHENPPDGTEFGLPVDGDPDDVARAFLAMRDGHVQRATGPF
jgi:hypothetical protein